MKKKLQLVIAIGFVVSCIYACKVGSESKLIFNYPRLSMDISKLTSLSCETIASAGIWGEEKNIEAEILRGTDKLAIKIDNDKTMSLITQASVGIGIAEPAKFLILQNDEATLVSIEYHESAISSSVNTFVLDKKNGLAMWAKTNPKYQLPKKPAGQLLYLSCK